jgi:hypothetical protein
VLIYLIFHQKNDNKEQTCQYFYGSACQERLGIIVPVFCLNQHYRADSDKSKAGYKKEHEPEFRYQPIGIAAMLRKVWGKSKR